MIDDLETADEEILVKKTQQYLSNELEGEVMTLAQIIEQRGLAQGLAQGFKQGADQEKRLMAERLLVEGMPITKVAKLTGISIDIIQQLQNQRIN